MTQATELAESVVARCDGGESYSLMPTVGQKDMTMDRAEIDKRITYHPPTDKAKVLHESVRLITANAMETLDSELPDSREKSVVMTKLEEVMFWANACIARNHHRI